MPIRFDHTIVSSWDKQVSAEFWADILGLELGAEMGPFLPLTVTNGTTFDFANVPLHVTEIQQQHYAFLVSEEEFGAAYAKIQRYGLQYWADPHRHFPGEINHNDGGRGIYFLDPVGHALELITVPYGGWPE